MATGPLADQFCSRGAMARLLAEAEAEARPSPWEALGDGPEALAAARAAVDACLGPVVMVRPYNPHVRAEAPVWQSGPRDHIRRRLVAPLPLPDPALLRNERPER